MPTRLTSDQLSLVLRRAAELEQQRDTASTTDAGITDAELAELTAEVGLPAADVTRALVEVRSGMVPAVATPTTLSTRLIGSDEIAFDRIVRGDVASIEARVATFMRGQLLEVRRNHGDRQVWAAAPGLLSKVQRVFDFGKSLTLPSQATVESMIAPIPGNDGQVVVRLVLRTTAFRDRKLSSMARWVGAGAAIAGIGLAAATGTAEIVTMSAGGLTAVGGALRARGAYRASVATAEESLAGLLDDLEHRRG